jgi:TonB family protein
VVADSRVTRSSGHDLLDQAARAVMSEVTFSPARNRGEAVAVWIQLPVTFGTRQQPS